ncbi:MAG: 30S ribosomal protein S9 [Ignavibacteriales bacterium]|nr:30S ribosomal protein S9 [Ignavibacteriales bacterium]
MAAFHRIAVGRRKTAVARVILKPGSGEIKINDIALEKYFPIETLKTDVLLPFTVTELLGKYDVDAIVNGGGSSGQAGAVKLGISRALVDLNNDLRGKLREHDLLTRDSRMVERKKYGQRKARKRFQFSKR